MDKNKDKHMDKEMENDKNEFEVKEMERKELWAETERVLAAKTVEGEFEKAMSRMERKSEIVDNLGTNKHNLESRSNRDDTSERGVRENWRRRRRR